LAGLLLPNAGCLQPQHQQPRIAPLPPVPMSETVGMVNRNIEKITAALRASGSVDGFFTTDRGRRVHYDVSGVLFYLEPRYVRFDLKKLGDRQLLFGSNDAAYWVYTKEDDAYQCGEHGVPGTLSTDLPPRPDQIPDALGLRPVLDSPPGGRPVRQVQRIVDEFQQILFLSPGPVGDPVIEKEYWLDRSPPRLVRHVVFRDADGAVEMVSDLGDYEPLGPNGPYLPSEMKATWPKAGAQMRFRVSKWELVPQVGPTGPQFATPPECATHPET
jgi:hypothetical protein